MRRPTPSIQLRTHRNVCLIYHPTPQRQLLAPCCFDTDYKRSVQDTLNQMTGAVESSAQG
ncbi:hypothetical protein [Methylomonas sp. MgM2]